MCCFQWLYSLVLLSVVVAIGAIVWVNLPQLVKVGVERGRAQQDVGCNIHATRHYFFKFFKYLGLKGCVGVTGPVTRWRLGMGRGTHATVLGLDQNAGSVAFCTYTLRWSPCFTSFPFIYTMFL